MQTLKKSSPARTSNRPRQVSRESEKSPLAQPVTSVPHFIQPKLRVGAVNDPLEREADRMAETVMRMPTSKVFSPSQPTLQRMTAEPAEEAEEMDEEPLQAKKNDASPTGQDEGAGEEVLQGKFNANQNTPQSRNNEGLAENQTGMPSQLKTGLETLSGLDLSGVRVHRNSSKPAQVDALAYTQGQNIHLGPGQEKHLPHEGWHVVQQLQGRVTPTIQAKGASINDDVGLEREADVMGVKALRMKHEDQNRNQSNVSNTAFIQPKKKKVISPVPNSMELPIQRAMKFEFQTKNRIWRNDGKNPPRLLDRKFGPQDFLVKGKTGVRLESESHGVLEFETDWFRKWSALEKQIKEAFDMTQEINSVVGVNERGANFVNFPFDVNHLRTGSQKELERGVWDNKKRFEGRNEKILEEGEVLEVEKRDPTWNAGIQSSESFLLNQYESFLRQHEFPEYKEPVIASAQAILDAVNTEGIPANELENLRNFLLIIVNYIKRGQGGAESDSAGAFASVRGLPSKQAFTLMSRTNFGSMYMSILSRKEKKLFVQIVEKNEILKQMGMNRKNPFFIEGYGSQNHFIGPTVFKWLRGIIQGRDLLSVYARRGLSASMGKFNVARERKKQKGLVRFETRNRPSSAGGAFRESKDWVAYAKDLFKFAAENRKRAEIKDDPDTKKDESEKTGLIDDSLPPSP